MKIHKIDENKKIIVVEIPLTTPTGKIRIKERRNFMDTGIPVATRQKPFNHKMYVEWQIGFDIELGSKHENNSTLRDKNLVFKAYNKKRKILYELSEYLYYFYTWNVISYNELKDLIKDIENTQDELLIENLFTISKSKPN